MTTLVFVRHAEPVIDKSLSHTKWQLSEKGVEMAIELSQTNSLPLVDTVYCSVETKAFQTAQCLNIEDVELNQRDSLNEIRLGDFLPFDVWEKFKKSAL